VEEQAVLPSIGSGVDLPAMPDPIIEDKKGAAPLVPPTIPAGLLDPDGVMGKPYVYPGFQGKPFRGPIPDLKKNDPAQPTTGMEGHAFVFDLSNAEHLAYYEKIFHMAYNGRAVIGIDRVDFDPKTGAYRAFVRWAFLFTHMKTQTGGPRG
jgi:hypothetical protein